MRRLLLFDIDGTLLLGGPAKGAFLDALLEVFGTTGPSQGHSFAGKTDPQIARELLTASGVDSQEIQEGLPRLWQGYLSRLEERIRDELPRVLPGVRELLDRLEETGDVALGLLTGNIVGGARLKLGSVDLFRYFQVGGYGSDSEDRDDLPAIAVGRARRAWSAAFRPDRVVVIGDTPRDVACGQAFGTRTLAVATGWHSRKELAAAGADRVLPDLADLDASLEALLDEGS